MCLYYYYYYYHYYYAGCPSQPKVLPKKFVPDSHGPSQFLTGGGSQQEIFQSLTTSGQFLI